MNCIYLIFFIVKKFYHKLMNNQSHFIKTTQCPRCAEEGRDTSKDNLAVYDDGHTYCYSCAYYTPKNSLKQLVDLRRIGQEHQLENFLKENLTDDIPLEALTWLSLYDIERFENKIKWSPSRNLLIFSFYGDHNNIIAYIGRNFNTEKKYKWRSGGKISEVFHIQHPKKILTNEWESCIILVEDVISSLKVSRQFIAMPLMGSYISDERFSRLLFFTKEIVFWLDKDKIKSASEHAARAQSFGFTSHIIYTEKDPKEYNNQEIKEIIESVKYKEKENH